MTLCHLPVIPVPSLLRACGNGILGVLLLLTGFAARRCGFAASALLMFVGSVFAMAGNVSADMKQVPGRVATGAEALVETGFAALDGKRVGLLTNQTGLVGGRHLADLLHAAPNVTLAAILVPEHGFRGRVEAGEKVRDGIDQATGVVVHSLYGTSRKPTRRMLRDVDILVFDIQDIGARFYTYISTMGLAMQAAAEAGIPFMVLDRPNPLGGDYVSGFVLESRHASFVGQYPIPIVHGLTVGELARMIQAERWLKGLGKLDLRISNMTGWHRAMRWPATGQPWVATSPNIPTFRSALVYPGIGIIGETQLVNEGRGTPEPFTVFGAPWLDAGRMVRELTALGLPGVAFQEERYQPRSIPGVAASPVFVGRTINGVRVIVTDEASYRTLEVGVHALVALLREARAKKVKPLFAKLKMFHAIAGTRRLYRMLMDGASGEAVIAAWQDEVAKFRTRAKPYLIY
ncbi:MAG: DUF1343 domain-containing protein [Alphaproteobacteria bacterium]|nr:DUF1343 domain-containing protein [Alphaproteobacteria bacterium]